MVKFSSDLLMLSNNDLKIQPALLKDYLKWVHAKKPTRKVLYSNLRKKSSQKEVNVKKS